VYSVIILRGTALDITVKEFYALFNYEGYVSPPQYVTKEEVAEAIDAFIVTKYGK